jgi:Leucine-rich repeat (LRR) protein
LDKAVFSKLAKMHTLSLKYNQVHLQGFFGGRNEVTDGGIRDPSFIFDGMPNLHVLELKGNPSYAVQPALFSRLTKLVQLDLSSCLFKKVDKKIFAGLGLLRSLDLSANQIATLAHATLTHDHVSLHREARSGSEKNGSSHGDGALFSQMASLETLYLQDNKLQTIQP